MQVDWFTVFAQVVNFLILIALLKHFLYQPVLHAMKQREQKIADRQCQADEEMLSAQRLAQQYQDQQKDLELQRVELMDKARQEAANQHTLMLAQLREEINQKRRSWQGDLLKEQSSLMRDIKVLIGEKVIQLSRQVLGDLAGIELEHQLVSRFFEQLAQLSEEETKKLIQAIKTDGQVTVVTGFTLGEQKCREIKDSLSQLQPGLKVRFRVRPEIVCGIVLETSGQIWPWSVDKYLDELEEALAEIVTPLKACTKELP